MKILRVVLIALIATTAMASDSQKSFDTLKTLSGSWAGKGSQGQPVQVSYRVTAGGSALMSEITGEHEDMVTMFHPDGSRLLMTHYCGAGNQPRMVGTASPDGKTITFNFLDATNLVAAQPGHMGRLVVTLVDANHHTEDWEFTGNDGKKMHEIFDLQRKN